MREGLRSEDFAHGVVEGQAEDFDEEVDRVAGEVLLGPAPIAVFHDEAGIIDQLKVVIRAFDQTQSAFYQKWDEWGLPSAADLLAGPEDGFSRGVDHSLFSNEVG